MADKFVVKESIAQGLTYIPDLLEISESGFVRQKVTMDYMDFVRSVGDLLTMISILKLKHLRSTKPLPNDVIREIRTRDVTKNKTLFTKFENDLPNLSVGISLSVDNLLKGPQASSTTRGGFRLKKRNQNKPCRTLNIPELLEIVGKKTKPIWHTVAKEKVETYLDHFVRMSEESKDKASKRTKPLRKDDVKPIPRDKRTKDEFSIKFATSDLCTMKMPSIKQQRIMEAYSAGFTSVECYHAALEVLHPVWFADIVKTGTKIGIPINPVVQQELSKLSKFFNVNCNTYPMARAKMCFIVQSLPIWDITRACTQRAIEFILKDILTIYNASNDLMNWLHARKLPYVVVPPIKASTDLESDAK